jgi:hypothetical protein
LIPLEKEFKEKGVMPFIIMEIALKKNEIFSFEDLLMQLKKIISRSNMYGGFFVEQLLRIFFFERTELLNL